jgi:hypothetical protein
MLNIGEELNSAISASQIIAVVIIDIDFPGDVGGPLRLTEAPRDIIVQGKTYLSNAILKKLTTPQAQSSVDRDNYKITFNDEKHELRERFAVKRIGIPVSIKLVFLREDGTMISEPLDTYKGQTSSMQWKKGELNVSLTGQLTQLAGKRTRYTTAESQQDLTGHNNDTCMRFVGDSVADNFLEWGRK